MKDSRAYEFCRFVGIGEPANDRFCREIMKMEELVKTILELEQYQCRKCGRFFYIHKQDKSDIEFDFGCCFGCDDNGRHIRNIKTEIQQVYDMPQAKQDNGDKNER